MTAVDVPQCDHLDQYLGGWLSDEQAAQFEIHLRDCPGCRQEAQQQRRIDRLLDRGARLLELAPALLIDRIERRLQQTVRRRAVRWAWGLAAAVLLILATGVGVAMRHFGTRAEPPAIAQQPDPIAAEPDSERPDPRTPVAVCDVEVTLDDPSEAILVPLPTQSPNVSIVWIYPTVKPDRTLPGPAADRPLSQ
ncbi:MAG: hypothetical protein A2V70_09120 [Planctomycetes bacterium RBG_13_63_9]|nr:MAG: hypothetical protein A2V70_09120 [Planctomycetes bacterium RBG_13_63_9]